MEIFPTPGDVFEPNRFLVILSVIILFSALVLWPLGWLFRRPFLNREGPPPPVYPLHFTLARVFTTILVILSLFCYFFIRKNPEWIGAIDPLSLPGADGWTYRTIGAIPVILAVLVPVQLLILIPLWKGRNGTRVFRIHYSLVGLALLTFLLFLISWNLIVPGEFLSALF